MKIAVLNGSPKGSTSVTMQYVNFIQKKFPQHELKILNISQRIKAIENDKEEFLKIIQEVKSSDGVLWAFPLYVFLVHSNYKRFIELVSEKGAGDAFKNKYVAVLTTSIHFHDHAAHNYMHAICDDLGMNYTGSFSADMEDLLIEKERERLVLFAGAFFEHIETQIPAPISFKPLVYNNFEYVPGSASNKIDIGNRNIVVLTDCTDTQTNLIRMIDRFKDSFKREIKIINLQNINIIGGCQGCLHCAYDNTCIYQGKDGFVEFYNAQIKTADILVFAGAIKDRYLSSRWKLFFDRSFFNTHIPTLSNKQIGFIISGPLSQIPNLRQIMEAYSEWQHGNLVDFITDEYEDSAHIDILLQGLADRLVRSADKSYIRPPTFLGIGGMKIFRDDIWGRLRFPFQADHKFYKKHRLYDFPQKNYKTRIARLILTLMTKMPAVRKEIYANRMKAEMIKPLQKILKTK